MPIAFDRYQPVEVSLVSGQVSGSWFHLGNNLVHLVAVDGAGNVAHCRFNIQVIGMLCSYHLQSHKLTKFEWNEMIYLVSDRKVSFIYSILG